MSFIHYGVYIIIHYGVYINIEREIPHAPHLQQAPVEEGPGEVVQRVLAGRHGARHHLGVEVVGQLTGGGGGWMDGDGWVE
jgi:hypothetical protein